jgi:hypothetical protein
MSTIGYRAVIGDIVYRRPSSALYDHFNTRRHLIAASGHRRLRDRAFDRWNAITASVA